VEQGIEDPPSSPFGHALQGWILGSQEFADRLRSLLLGRDEQQEVPRDRRLRCLDVSLVWEAVANDYGVKQESLGERSQHTEMRSVAAWLAKRHTQATLRELAKPLVPDQDPGGTTCARRWRTPPQIGKLHFREAGKSTAALSGTYRFCQRS
jgi:hypothetical protein